MTYTHLTTDELVMIESYYHQNITVPKISAYLKRSRTSIYTVIKFLKESHTDLDYYQQYKENKKRCGRRKIDLPTEQQALNENFNGLLRKDGLPKEMGFNQVDQAFLSSVANKRNNIPRKPLDYQTPFEVFLSYLDESILSSLY